MKHALGIVSPMGVLGNACHAEPPACTLFMTSRCNLACSWCRRAKIGVRQTPPVSLEVVRALLGQYPGIAVFAMAGQGEPTLAPEFSDIVRSLPKRARVSFWILMALTLEKWANWTVVFRVSA